jgi:DNA polymerase III subunit epsilon
MMRLLRRGARSPFGKGYPEGPIGELAAAPPAPSRTPFRDVAFLAVDLETTGLDARRDHVLAAGWVPVIAGEVVLRDAREVLVRPPVGVSVGESATFHGLTDDGLADASHLRDALPDLLEALRGRVLVAHHAPLELGFLTHAVRAAYGARLSVTAVDTMQLQHRLVVGPHGDVAPGALRLDAARHHLRLPRYTAHRASIDAIATAELLLAQTAELAHRLGHEPTLGDLSPIHQH